MEYRKTTLSKISNTIFLSFSIFVLSFIWVNYYTKNLSISLLSAIIICLALIIIHFVKFHFDKKKIQASKSKIENELNIKNYLLYSKNDENVEYICKIFKISSIEKIDENHYIDKSKKIDYFFNFTKETIKQEEIIQYFKTRNYDDIVLFCISCEKFLGIENCNFDVIDFVEIQKECEYSHINYDIVNIKKSPKISLNDILCTVLCKTKSKGYFWFGIMLVITSLFTIYTSYYIVMGSILIILSVFCRFNSTFNKKTLP